MSVHTKKHRTKDENKKMLTFRIGRDIYHIPVKIAERYRSKESRSRVTDNVSIEEAFSDLISKYGEKGALLRGLRSRESLTQAEFAKKLNINQSNLSAMEHGKRPIGKEMAKKIGKVFKTDYRLFL